MNAATQRWCAYAGPLMMVIFMVGFCFVAGLIPPPPPGNSAEQIAGRYADDANRIRIGLIISMFGAALSFPFAVVIFVQLRRLEGYRTTPMAYLQLTTGLLNTPLFVLPMFAMAAATYRPESRDPQITEALHDLGWLTFVAFPGPAILQLSSIAVIILRDRSEQPVFPRWLAYFNVWCAFVFVFGPLAICFHDGPFAWNGVFVLYIPLTVFSSWFFVMTYWCLRAIKNQEQVEEQELRDLASGDRTTTTA